MDLYIRPTRPVLEKIAASEVSLPDDANAWPHEIMQELYKQVPYCSDFDIDVTMDRVDAERGFGFGHILLASKTEAQHGSSPMMMHSIGVNKIRVPIIIRERKLLPFDIIVTEDSKMLPLTEKRLRMALFRPQPFDVTSRTPGDQSMIGQLYPPYRQNSGGFGGGGGTVTAGMGKEGAAEKCSKCGSMEKCACMAKKAAVNPMPTAAMPNVARAATKSLGHVKPPSSFGGAVGKSNSSGMFAAFDKAEKINPKMTLRGSERAPLPEINYLPKTGSAGAHPLNERIQTVLGLHTPPPAEKKKEKAAGLVPDSNIANQNTPSIKQKLGSILPIIVGMLSASDYNKFASAVSEEGVQEAYAQNGYATVDALQTILGAEPQSVEKRAAALEQVVRPDVVQVTKAEHGYTVKTARHDMWAPKSQAFDRGQVVRALGEKVAFMADTTGSATILKGASVTTPEEGVQKSHVVVRGGMYKVRTDHGVEVVGYVFPNLIDMDGTVLPMALFTNGSVGALQAEILGEPIAEAKNPPSSAPVVGEHGLYFRTKPDGEIEVTVPVKMLGTFNDPDGSKQMVETIEGAQVLVASQPNIKKLVVVDNTCLLPNDFKWMPLGHLEEISLETMPEQGLKQAHALREYASVVIRSGGSDFSFSGFPVEKLAQADTNFLNMDDSLFLLGGLGVELSHAAEKLAEASSGAVPVQVRVGRMLKTAGERMSEQRSASAVTLSQLPDLRQDLFKEAAFIPDPMAVDTVLALGFINPENLSTFVTYLPQMEQAQQRMCELLIASRLGLKALESGPLEKAIKSLEISLDGLKVIAFQKN